MLIKSKKNREQCTLLGFSSLWAVLGPFQIGTREASWGADPLEYLGGFHALEWDSKASYPSSLASNGRVSWSFRSLESSSSHANVAEASLNVTFPHVDWKSLQSVYGWAALQYQTWARGHLTIEADFAQSIALYTDNVLEYWVDDDHYFGGDFYAYRSAPLVLCLGPGSHKLDIRLVRDVRVMGGVGEPEVSIKLMAECSHGGLAVLAQKLLISDVVSGALASPFASVPVRNEGTEWIEILDITTKDGPYTATILDTFRVRIAPGQSRPLPFRLLTQGVVSMPVSLEIIYAASEDLDCLLSTVIIHEFVMRDNHSPHKFTFLHPSGIVSYAILRSPSRKVTSEISPRGRLPIILNLHGAGLEADSRQVRHTLDSAPDVPAWVLFPTGVTSWSSDDWHTWGFADVEAAVAAIAIWIKTIQWKGPNVHMSKWLVSGHSNGGQGTWYALTHRPDNIIGAAPVSGYSSIQGYVPYQMWKEAEPRVTLALQNAMQSFRHELFVSNFKGIPLLQQHGSADNNVPAFHSRLMNLLVSHSAEQASHRYVELDGKGHWFDGVMTTEPLREFYDIVSREAEWPELPESFNVVIADPAGMGPRGGLTVDQLIQPDQLGKIAVVRRPASATWVIKTSNILRFHFVCNRHLDSLPQELIIDNACPLQLPQGEEKLACWLVRSDSGSWDISCDRQWLLEQRCGAQLGSLSALLRSSGCFLIRALTVKAAMVTLQISRNLFQYFAADSEIVDSTLDLSSRRGNVISIACGLSFRLPLTQSYPIGVGEGERVQIRNARGKVAAFDFEEGMGIILLKPLLGGRLETVVWGLDSQGLQQAVRLLPMLTGVCQPDFIILSRRCAWEGAAGVLAMGSFDSFWKVSEASFIS